MTTTTYCTQFLKGIGDNANWKPTVKLVSGTCRSSLFIGPAAPVHRCAVHRRGQGPR